MDSHHRPPRAFPWRSATELLSINIIIWNTFLKAPDPRGPDADSNINPLNVSLARDIAY